MVGRTELCLPALPHAALPTARFAPPTDAPLQGVVQHATINNLAFGRNVDETLRVLQASTGMMMQPSALKGPACSSHPGPRRRWTDAQPLPQPAAPDRALLFPSHPPRSTPPLLPSPQALQYVQSHPDEVCPAGWQPGSATMKPDPQGSKEYFSKI